MSHSHGADRQFDPGHQVQVRTPEEVKAYGKPEKPYIASWDYPVFQDGQFSGLQKRRQIYDEAKAIEFAQRHRILWHRLPEVLIRAIRAKSTKSVDSSKT
jgi:hypothetical protein